jgi:hypothetical protein
LESSCLVTNGRDGSLSGSDHLPGGLEREWGGREGGREGGKREISSV